MAYNEEEGCCDAKRPSGFTFYASVTVCNKCLTQFPYYECYCELQHDDCSYGKRHKNAEYFASVRNGEK